MTRLFVATWPPAGVRDRLAEFTTGEPLGGERRVADENWHVTLRFIGNADVDEVSGRLRDADLPTVRAVLGPEVVDLGGRQVVVPVTGVDPLAAAVRRATTGIGVHDGRPFFGHLTLARLRDGAMSVLLSTPITASFPIDEVALVRSETRSTGAVYETVATFPTGAPVQVRASTGLGVINSADDNLG